MAFVYNVLFVSVSCQLVLSAAGKEWWDRRSVAEACVRSQVSPCGICGEQGDTGTGFPRLLVFSLSVSFHLCSILYLLLLLAREGPRWLSRYSDLLLAGRSGDRIPVGARFSAPVQAGPGAHPATYTMVTVTFPGKKRPGLGVDHPPHLAPRLKKE
jgi:hypothetical protein